MMQQHSELLVRMSADIAELKAQKAAPNLDKDFLTLSETGAFLGVGRTALYELRKRRDAAKSADQRARRLPPECHNGKGIVFRRADLETWVDGRKRGPGVILD